MIDCFSSERQIDQFLFALSNICQKERSLVFVYKKHCQNVLSTNLFSDLRLLNQVLVSLPSQDNGWKSGFRV